MTEHSFNFKWDAPLSRKSDQTLEDIIIQALQGALVVHPQEDDVEYEWIAREQCIHVAKTIVSELTARGFEIVRNQFDKSEVSARA